MSLIIREISAKSILTKSGIPGVDYCINPYIGCSHGCRYCYATFMKRYTGHTEAWGSFVDVKINAPEILQRQLKRAKRGRILISSVTDAYQPIESKYKLTRQCLEILLQSQFPVDILTKSPLVLRDTDLIKKFKDIEVGITITTNDEKIRKIFEPNAPSIMARIRTLKALHDKGLKTYAFIGPVLPMNPESLSEKISPYADSIIIDRMNYTAKTLKIYQRMNLDRWLDNSFINNIIQRLRNGFTGKPVSIC
ncbi:MAG TPA: radical SAM protein [Candidatus Wunengus sp. YC60]|uniref:radical SAM protein n=1 Tax=Candidatus Wunengus sp. YC60 TaxID=3367697 RepID=UPI0040296F4E